MSMTFRGAAEPHALSLRRASAFALLLCLLTGACSGGGTGPSGGQPVRLGLVVGPSATAQSGVPFDPAPAVELLDGNGQVATRRGVAVSVEVTTGGASLVGATLVRTDANGRAVFEGLGLAGPAGPHTLRFTSAGLTAALSGTIALQAGPVAVVGAAAGSNQTAPVGTAVPIPPAVIVTDASGNPVAGVGVTFEVTAGGGTLEGATQTTGSDGVARVGKWILGAVPGVNQLAVTPAGLQGSPLVFTATATPTTIVGIVSGSSQTGFVGDPLGQAITVRVTGGSSAPKPGVTVTFTVLTGGGSFGPASAVTDSTGIAAAFWRLGSAEGLQTAEVRASGSAPAEARAIGVRFRQVSAAATSACGLTTTGQAWCWGNNLLTQLGDGTHAGVRLNPVRVVGGLQFTLLSSAGGGNFHCGLLASQAAFCWGSARHGQLGDGQTPLGGSSSRNFPVQVSGGFLWAEVKPGGDHACGVTTAGSAYCWGANGTGQVGDGSLGTDLPTPVAVAGGLTIKTIAPGRNHTCAIASDDTLHCWGLRAGFTGGSGTSLVPEQISTGVVLVSLSAGWSSNCGLTSEGQAYCWGSGDRGQLGDGFRVGRGTLAPVNTQLRFTQLDARGQTPCGVTTSGEVYCWGANNAGQAGIGALGDVLTPSRVIGPGPSEHVTSSGFTGCLLEKGAPRCWGPNDFGQVGDGTRTQRPSPVRVVFP